MKRVMGTVTIIAIVGGTIYAIKKSKDLKKEEEGSISVEEAMDMVQEQREMNLVPKDLIELEVSREEEMYEASEEFGDLIEDIRDDANWNRSFMPEENPGYSKVIKGIGYDTVSEEIEEEEEEQLEDEGEPLPTLYSYKQGDIRKEEEHILRFDPHSQEALDQYIKMELAEWLPLEDTYSTLMNLFQVPYQPLNDGDAMLRNAIMDYRVQFFGFDSRWVKPITFADVILHYAKAAQYNCNETVKYWAEYFLEFNEIDYTTPPSKLEHLIGRLNNHSYFNEERQTFGLFGLDQQSMDQAVDIANRNIDRSVTYEIEFNEFLKSQF